jgi:putative spermidine/putrescine transport system permease protein
MRFLRTLIITLLIISILLPFIPLIVWSFSYRWYFPALLPTEWSFRAWRYIFSDTSHVLTALMDSTIIALSVTLLSIIIGLPAGRALGLYQFWGKDFVRLLILTPTIVPTLSVALGIHGLFIRYGLADTLLGVILVHLIPVLPYMVLVLASVFSNYDLAYEEQARSLGANPLQVFYYITLPTILPGLMVGSFFAFIISWSQYVLTLLIGGGQVVTLPILLFTFANSGDNPLTAALSLIFIIPAVLFILLTTPYLSGHKNVWDGLGKL